jgi:transcriptional regulator with XRE-family HTH domain
MSEKIHFADKHVGQRLRIKRVLAGFSQTALASELGITFQQVQKYEHGTNRMSAGRLYDTSLALKEPVSYFFEGLPAQGGDKASKKSAQADRAITQELKRDALELMKVFYSISDPRLRKHVKDLLRALAKSG